MYQQEMFRKLLPRNAIPCGEGHVASVLDLGDGWVFKHANHKDETLNYLEWCVLMTKAGKGMKGMPDIDRIIHLEEGYIVLMRKYEYHGCKPSGVGYPSFNGTGYCAKLIEAYRAYMTALFGTVCRGPLVGETSEEWNEEYEKGAREYACDLHGGNYMWDNLTNGWIVTDPSALSYLTIDEVSPLELH